MKPDEVMRWTLREMALYAEGQNKRELEQWRQDVTIAYTTAQLMRQKKLPKLEKLLPKTPVKRMVFKDRTEYAAHSRLLFDQLAAAGWGDVTYGKKEKRKK